MVLIGMKEAPAVVLPVTHAIPVNTEIVKNGYFTHQRFQWKVKVEAWHRIDLFAEVNGVLNILVGKNLEKAVKVSERAR